MAASAPSWDVTFCFCKEDPERHVHCHCSGCKGNKIVSRATAFRHRSRDVEEHVFRNDSANSSMDDNSFSESQLIDHGNCEISNDNPENNCENDVLNHSQQCVETNCEISSDNLETNDNSTAAGDPVLTYDLGAIEQKIVSCILDALDLQLKLQISITGFEHILEWGKKLFTSGFPDFEYLWPNSWEDCEKYLHSVGYRDARKYMICLDESHRCHYGIMSSEDDLCPHCSKKGKIPFYYLGLGPKINLWTKNYNMCEKMLAHWFHKENWIEEEHKEDWGYALKKEIWDGKRFADLQWFWDPNKEWTLPTKCHNCKTVISAESINAQVEDENGDKLLQCPICYKKFKHQPCRVHGDPRNIAYIVHWDGFQPFNGKYNHGCGAIEVQIANMSKADRYQSSEIYVIGFIPVYLLPNKRPISLDPFLSLLIDEIEDGFINGIEVQHYAYPLPDLPAGPTKLRHLILLCTGDHPAICEMCKAIYCGKNPCRRCKCGSTLVPSTKHYYYGDYRKSAKYPWQKRDLMLEIDNLNEIEEEERRTVAEAMAKDAGFTGLSILHRLHSLYGFDYRRDCVFDAMHLISLCVVKNFFHNILQLEIVTDDKSQVQQRLQAIPWTAEFMSSRYPTQLSRIGHWKAEDFQKFAFPIAEYVFGDMLPDQYFEGIQALARLVEFIYVQGRNGWTVDSIAIFHAMVFRFNVMVEESFGLEACHVVNHNLTHIHEDVMNFGASDNYWCYNFERAVGRYVSISSNNKNLELTFARAELRREVLKSTLEKHAFNQASLESHYSSFATLEDALKNIREANHNHEILVGSLIGVHLNDQCLINEICKHLDLDNYNDLSQIAHQCRSVYLTNTNNTKIDGILYRVGEHVICSIPSFESGEQIVAITSILQVKVHEQYLIIVLGDLFDNVTVNNERLFYPRNNGYMSIVAPSNQQVTFLASCMQRKVMLAPDPVNIEDPKVFVVIDYMRRDFTITSVVVPCYPEVGDMILVQGDEPEPWRAVVVAVHMCNKTVDIQFYMPHPRWGRNSRIWVREATRVQKTSFKCIVGIVHGQWQGTGNAQFKEV